jgi:hypothetical protein
MPISINHHQRNLALWGFALFILAAVVRWIPGIRIIDDAYITFRYVENILDGHGFVYNLGDPVLGTTTPLYTLMLVSITWLFQFTGAQIPDLAVGFNAALDGITCLVLWRLGTHLHSSKAGVGTAVLWAFAPFSVTFSIGGLETSLLVLLLISSVYAYQKDNKALSAFLGSLAILTRPDAVILVGLLSLHFMIDLIKNRSRGFFKEACALIIPLAIWGVISTFLFGSPIPQSVQAKMVAYHLPEAAALIRLIQHYATPFMLHYVVGAPVAIAIGMILYPFLFVVGARQALRADPRIIPFVLYPWLYFVIFSAANPLIFRWYLTPPLPAYFLFIIIGAETISVSILAKLNWRKSIKQAVIWSAILVLPLLSTLSAWELKPDHGPNRPAPQMAWIKLELIYEQIAIALLPDIKSNTVIAAGDVGALGYVTKASILDTVGLNSPQAVAYYPLPPEAYVINYAIPSELILDYRPDIIVFLEIYGRNTLLQNDRFLETYRPYLEIPTTIYGSKAMYVYRLAP